MANCKLERPSPKVLFKTLSSMFSANVLGGAPIIPESNEHYVVANDYAMAEQFYSVADQQWKERDPRYACCENLIDMASIDGVYPRPAGFASGYVQIKGTAGTDLPTSLEFTFGSYQYVSTGAVPIEIAGNGTAVVRVRAVEPGPSSNLSAGVKSGTLNTVIANVSSTATVYGNQFCGGTVAEDCETFRARYLERMRYKPFVGLDYIKQKLLEWPCVTTVCERGGVCCDDDDVQEYVGGVDCNRSIRLYVLFEGTFPCGLAPKQITDEITEWMFGNVQGIGSGQAPWGMTGKIYTATPTYADIVIDGLACITPGMANEIRMRLTEYVGRICPSEPLYVRDIQAIISQIMSGTGNYDVMIRPKDSGAVVNNCGDLEPKCDYRICLTEVLFSNPNNEV